MPPRSVAALLVALALLATAASVGATTSSTTGPLDVPASLASTSDPLSNTTQTNTTMRIQLRPNGNARWTVSTSFVVSTPAEREAFERLATAFENGNAPRLGIDAFRAASEAASAATGREMTIRNVSYRYEIGNRTGRLVLSFVWTNFGRIKGNRLYVGDAFNTTNGTWLGGLSEGQTLIISPPEGYGVFGAPVGPDNGTVRWSGETRFGADGPWVIYQSPQPGQTTTTTTMGPPSESASPWASLSVFLAALVVLLVAYAWRTERLPDVNSTQPADGDAGSDGDDATAAESTGDEPTVREIRADAEQDTETTRASDEEDVDEELLSDEERVERILEENGGRMKQANIVKETGWSNAKVSQLLSSMAEEGRIEKLRIGRENLISFPDEDVTDFDN